MSDNRHYTYAIKDLLDQMDHTIFLLYDHHDPRARWTAYLVKAWKEIAKRVYNTTMTPEDYFNVILFEVDEAKSKLDANGAERQKLQNKFDEVMQRQAQWTKENAK